MMIRKAIHKIINRYREKNFKKHILGIHQDDFNIDQHKVFDARKYGFSFLESKTYSFPKNDYREYISTWESYQPRTNNTQNSIVSDNKFLFSLVFKDLVDVPECYAFIINGAVCPTDKQQIDCDNLYSFIMQKKDCVIKPADGSDGFGILVLTTKDGKLYADDKEMSEEDLKKHVAGLKNAIIQKRLTQGEFENGLYDRTINTVRIISVKKKNAQEHEIIAASQRIGTSQSFPVDNFNQGGLAALVDLETGELSAASGLDSFDENGNRIFYDRHPDSGAPIKGAFIPNWDKVKETIVDLTRKRPLFNYIAWDVVIKDDGIGVIETNMKASLKMFQIHGGMRNKYLGQKYKEYGYIKD